MSDKPDDIVGHKTFSDGKGGRYYEPLTRAEGDAIWKACEEEAAARAAQMPTEQDALNMLQKAYTRLKELGWNDACYCPKDGSSFNVIEAGSSGVHRCHYEGEWPDGSWWVEDEGDLWPSRPILFKRDQEKEAQYKAKLEEAGRKFREEMNAEDMGAR